MFKRIMHFASLGLVLSLVAGVSAQNAGTTPRAEQPAVKPGAHPNIELSPREFDFGEVWEDESVQETITVKNTGDAPLNIISVRGNCGCTVPTRPKSPLQPGESDTFTITYSTKRIGKADKKVTVRSNDPNEPQIVIPVKGLVKRIYESDTHNRVSFRHLDPKAIEESTITLENKFDEPLPLKLAENWDTGPFDVRLKEVDEGQKYELTVKTRPPLRIGNNRARVKLETPKEDLPDVLITINANVIPRVTVVPSSLFVSSNRTEPFDQTVKVRFRADQPIKVESVRAVPETIKAELEPMTQPFGRSVMSYQPIKLTLPAFDEIPAGAKLIVTTNDPDERYHELEMPILKRPTRAGRTPAAHGHIGRSATATRGKEKQGGKLKEAWPMKLRGDEKEEQQQTAEESTTSDKPTESEGADKSSNTGDAPSSEQK